MVEGLDMSLDDLRKHNKTIKMGQPTKLPPLPPQHRPSGEGHGPTRRVHNRRKTRNASPCLYSLPHHENWRMQSVICDNKEVEKEEEAKLYVSNLHYEVSNNDIKVLFSDVGELKRYAIHYDSSGRSMGSAEVVFVHKSDAIAAMTRYKEALLDGRPLCIELIGQESIPPPVPPNVTQQQMPRLVLPTVPNWQMASHMRPPVPHSQLVPMPQAVPYWQITPSMPHADPHWQREEHAKRKRGGGSQSFSQGQKAQGKRQGKVSADDLDADLEKYISKRKENTL